MTDTASLDERFPGGWDYAVTRADADKLYAGGITPVQLDGEPWPTPTVEIPEDVRDNSETVTDYAFMRHRSPNRGVVTPGARDRSIDTATRHLPGYQHYTWLDVNPDGQRCRFDMIVNRHGNVVNLFHTEYWTRVACARGDWCHSYATHYTVVTDSDGKPSDTVPYCDEHVDELRHNLHGLPLRLHLSERLLIGSHD